MVLKVGTLGKVRFIRGIKKTNIFECGGNGVVVERENNVITMYVTNAACSKIYCTIPLGTNTELKGAKFIVVAYNDHVMLLEGGGIMVVADYDVEQVAVNKPEIKVTGKAWGEDAQAPWEPEYGGMFGL